MRDQVHNDRSTLCLIQLSILGVSQGGKKRVELKEFVSYGQEFLSFV